MSNENKNFLELIKIDNENKINIPFEIFKYLNSLKNEDFIILSVNYKNFKENNSFINNLFNIQEFDEIQDNKGIFILNKPLNSIKNKKILLIIDNIDINENNIYESIKNIIFLISNICLYNIPEEINEEILYKLFDNINLINDKLLLDKNYLFNNLIIEKLLQKNILIFNNNKEFENINDCYINYFSKNNQKKNIVLGENNVFKLINNDDNILNIIDEIYSNKEINIYKGITIYNLLLNYIEYINLNKKINISEIYENIFLLEAKNNLNESYESFRNELNKNIINNKYPLNLKELYNNYFDLKNKETLIFCEKSNNYINSLQTGKYLINLYNKMNSELKINLEKNEIYNKNFIQNIYEEFLNFNNNNSNFNINKIEDLSIFIKEYFNIFITNIFKKFYDYFDNTKLIEIFENIFENINKKFLSISNLVEIFHNKKIKENNDKLNKLEVNINKLNEEINSKNLLYEEKSKEINIINKNFFEIENKYNKLFRESKKKEEEFNCNYNFEIKKYEKMENYYLNSIKEKENENLILQTKNNLLKKELIETTNKNFYELNEINRKKVFLDMEIEKLKNKKIEKKNTFNLDNNNIYQNILKTFQEFKENLEKIYKKNNFFDDEYINNIILELENKINNWKDDIKNYKEDEIREINEQYEIKLKNIKTEIEEIKFELTKKKYELNEQIQFKNIYEKKDNENKTHTIQLKEQITSFENLLKTQEENVNLLKQKEKNYLNEKNKLEIALNKNIVDFRMKEDEFETLMVLVGNILNKKKDIIEKNLLKLSNENQQFLINLLKKHKWFK